MSEQGAKANHTGHDSNPLWLVLLLLVVLFVLIAFPTSALGAVTTTIAEVRGSELHLQGSAIPGSTISVDGLVVGLANASGAFSISRTPYTPPASCVVTVSDGTQPVHVTLSGCTPATATATATIKPTATDTAVSKSTATATPASKPTAIATAASSAPTTVPANIPPTVTLLPIPGGLTDVTVTPASDRTPTPVVPAGTAVPDVGTLLQDALDNMMHHKGTLTSNIPTQMRQGQTVHAEASITWNTDQPVPSLEGPGPVTKEEIPVSSLMSVVLEGNNDFAITPHSDQEQVIGRLRPTHWEWDVTALKPGAARELHLRVTAIVRAGDREGREDIEVVNRVVYVEVDPVYSVQQFVQQNWMWVAGSLGAAAAAVWRSRKTLLRLLPTHGTATQPHLPEPITGGHAG